MMLQKVAVCLSSTILGEALKRLLVDDFDILHIVNCSRVEQVCEANPDLLVTDFYQLQCFFGSDSADSLKILLIETEPALAIEEQHLVELIEKGLLGIIPAVADISQFKKAIERVISGELWFDRRKLSSVILAQNHASRKKESSQLTKTEIEVVKLICKGCSNKEIMQNLSISNQAVKSHLNRIYRKVHVSDRLRLLLYALDHWPSYVQRSTPLNPVGSSEKGCV